MTRRGLLTFGETMGRISADGVGPLDAVRSFGLSIAGAESTVAIGAARLGAGATWVGRVGPDGVGDLIERRLRADGVRARVIRDASFTGLMISSRRTSAGVRVDYHRAGSAGSRLGPGDVDEHLIAEAAILHVTGITPALGSGPRDLTQWAVGVARAAGTPVSVDVNYRSKLWSPERARPVLRELVESADVVFAGPEEALLVLGEDTSGDADTLALAHALARLGPAEAVVKDGPRGCVAVIDGAEHLVPAVPVRAVDPVGAGDAFVAGYLAERLAGADAATRLATAVRAGAYAVTVPGDCEGLPDRYELSAFANEEDVAR